MQISKLGGTALLLVLALSHSYGATVVPVIPPIGATEMTVTGINDNNIIAGGYIDSSNIEHAFFGSLDGNYTVFDFSADFTEARAINKDGTIVGLYDSGDSNQFIADAFERTADGVIKSIKLKKTVADGIVEGINSKGVFIGENWDHSTGAVSSYTGRKAKYKDPVIPGIPGTNVRARGINDSSDVVGYMTNGNIHGFLIHNGVATQIDYPDPNVKNTFLQSINNKGVIAGHWTPDNMTYHAFYLDQKTGTFTPIDIPGMTSSTAFGINNAGLIMVTSTGPNAPFYVYCPKAKKKCPGNGMEITDANPIHVVPGSFLRYGNRPIRRSAALMVDERSGIQDGALRIRH